MNRDYHAWYSPSLQRTMEMLAFGHAGEPVLAIPTSRGRFFEWENFGMVDAVRDRVEEGRMQIFCVDSVDAESWYNRGAHPADKIRRDDAYDAYLIHEVVPFIRSQNDRPLTLAGASFGGMHTIDKGLRHPDVYAKLLSMSGAYASSWFLRGYDGLDAYLHAPLRYLPDLHDPWFLGRIRAQTILLAVPERDRLRSQNEKLARLFAEKDIGCYFDLWPGYDHDWNAWRGMLRKHCGW